MHLHFLYTNMLQNQNGLFLENETCMVAFHHLSRDFSLYHIKQMYCDASSIENALQCSPGNEIKRENQGEKIGIFWQSGNEIGIFWKSGN